MSDPIYMVDWDVADPLDGGLDANVSVKWATIIVLDFASYKAGNRKKILLLTPNSKQKL